MNLIQSRDAAARLARTIVSDIAIYNREKVLEGIKNDNIFELLEKELGEGLDLYRSRVAPGIDKKNSLYNKAIVDILIKRSGNIESDIW
ncbi:MAG TPA: hypothetical protein DDW94_08720 [Deltaproteobacteria bacterium]|nr:MAG: hypothetical protein A2Z79_03230 [Deltaproteobacteria bacterium GWA2_55_82]OGQ62295.1 MAG: hypothetical protein A3I81_05140 [Deltaproteobacteria bacterium RIFCSPLOWO2_02_FULL_55_12]OIJ74407.1 MAG: hypothetical protein A2V21_309130 [Deltaproteobacteria bacterium GWC2_55_46]HBG47057.1 hypothetical protein [Deltaproteobacteria bacterium]HCY10884.1 hypothetical protein [Deltaproteobacteria bacterium]